MTDTIKHRRGPVPKYSPEISNTIRQLRTQRCYWAKKLVYAPNEESENECREHVRKIVSKIAELTGENVDEIYCDFCEGCPGRPKKS